MDLLDRLLAHDAWTTRQLLLACHALPDEALDRAFEIDHRTLRETFAHMIANQEVWTDLMRGRAAQARSGTSMAELLGRHSVISRDLADLARAIAREGRWDACFVDTLDAPPRPKTFGGGIGHVLTHDMHHRAHILWLMERVGLREHLEGDLLSWESQAVGWGGARP